MLEISLPILVDDAMGRAYFRDLNNFPGIQGGQRYAHQSMIERTNLRVLVPYTISVRRE
ncbi:hypothetical protein [Metallosphaera hakonensis]|uniref:hypothetical protein n=1 Tax=Metallosphaera hakonensis TaxID=79601 RepID=UPI000A87C723|nr:hypothetical protein [Metallosphaera hakonensis]